MKEAETRRKGLAVEQYHQLRARCKRDLFFFCTGVLNYTRLSIDLHGHFCSQIQTTASAFQYREFLLPRAHFKSTIKTISHTIQVVLPYTERDREHDEFGSIPLPHPMELGPDGRVVIGHETVDGAARFLFAITAHLTGNPALLALFPELVPNKKYQKINKYELELPRQEPHPDPTIDTMGVGQRSQGRHYHLLNLDDIYGDKARDSETESRTCKEWVDGLHGFTDAIATSKIDFVGTRYKFDDVYGHIEERYDDKLFIYRRSVVEKDENGVEQPIFPEEITHDSLRILKKNQRVYRAQYLNDPEMDSTGFNKEWKRYFFWKSRTYITFESKLKGRQERYVPELAKAVIIDPGEATGGMVVTGADHDLKIFTLQAIPIEFNPSVLIELLFKLVQRWQPKVVAVEKDALQNVYLHWLRAEMPRRGIYFNLIPVQSRQRAADLRISSLIPYMTSESFFMHETQTELLREFDIWGKVATSAMIHIFSALGYGPEIWTRGLPPGTLEKIHSMTEEDMFEGRDPLTGYSEI